MKSLAADLFADLRADTPAAARPSSLQEFLETDIQTDRGPWNLAGYEPFGEIIELLDRAVRKKESGTEISILAAEQVGKTLIAAGFGIRLAADHGVNVGYFLPTDKAAHKFGRTRLKRIIARSPYLAARMRDREAVNQSTLKEFDGHFLYILGLESMLNAISIPLDVLVYDEVDQLPEENKEWSQGRVAASDLRITLNVSAGYIPGGGIDRLYQEGTQHRYLLDCSNRACLGKKICLEETFPDCVERVRGVWKRVCPKCKTDLDLAKGRWVASYPERAKDRKYSFRVSSLIIAGRDTAHIISRWEKAKRKKSQLAKFRCVELAIPDAGAMQPITDRELAEMESPELKLRLNRGALPRYAGMDTGDLCHFYCHERLPSGESRLVWAQEIDSDIALDEVGALIANLGVHKLVVDKKPLTTLARALAYRYPRVVALQDFTDSSEMKVVEEEHERRKFECVKVHRDESLDDFTSEITTSGRGLRIPEIESHPVLAIVAEHFKNLRKGRSIDAKGRVVDKYVKGVANHFGMAANSARLAELIAPMIMDFRFTPIDADQTRRSFRPAKQWGGLLGG